jgi:hypothetical protein
MLTHLGLDALGAGAAAGNRLAFRRSHGAPAPRGLSGPFLSGLSMDFGADLWTGEVSARGNRVSYRHLQAVEGLELDAVFTVEPDRLVIELRQSCEADMPVLDAGAWRLVWDLTAGITGAAGVPTLLPGRNGDVAWPTLWATDGAGCLSCRLLDGDPDDTRLQVESHRAQNVVTGAFVMAPRPLPDGCLVLPAGTRKATVELAAALLEPERRQKGSALHAGIRRHWGTVFSCFRPEYRGFSNHSASCNCHVSQAAPTEIVAHTRRPKIGPDPLALARFTIGRALLDGGGYGYWRNLYLDSDPNLVCAAGRIHQAEPDAGWLRRIEPGLVETVERMAGTLGRDGLVICRDLSGDSGSFRWSTNSMDVIGFGHMDAYVNAWTYRAFRNAVALLDELGRDALADQCREWAQNLEAAYAPALVNPKTGWIAGWRSRDGKLHDYAFIWVNGPAIAFGLLDRGAARKALAGLERLRAKVCPISERLGLPLNLMPISVEDHMLPRVLGGTQPTFESYTDGSLSGWPATYYLRALSIYGFKRQARRIATAMAEGYAAGVFSGGNGTGSEFRTWDGTPTGYEGTLIGCFGPMYSIAVEIGGLIPRSPEWWPAGG